MRFVRVSLRRAASWERVGAEAERVFGVRLDDAALGKLEAHAALIQEWSRRLNLVSWRTEEELLFRHFLDSLAPLRLLRPGEITVADVGSGAGLPGIPIAVARADLVMVLVESRRRRASFLRHVVRALGLGNVRIEEARAEDMAGRRERHFDVVLGRAVRPAVVIDFASVALRDGGSAILMGKASDGFPVPVGFETGSDCVYELPGREVHVVRELLVSRETSGHKGGVLNEQPKRRV